MIFGKWLSLLYIYTLDKSIFYEVWQEKSGEIMKSKVNHVHFLLLLPSPRWLKIYTCMKCGTQKVAILIIKASSAGARQHMHDKEH